MLKFPTDNPKSNPQFERLMAILNIIFHEETEDNITAFLQLTEDLLQNFSNTVNEFEHILHIFTNVYINENKTTASPLWQLLAASAIMRLYIHSIPETGEPLIHPNLRRCIKWAEAVVNFPAIDHPLDAQCKYTACDWLANFYMKKAKNETKTTHIKLNSRNPLIKLSLQYYEKMFEILNGCKQALYGDISSTLLNIVSLREKFLPDDATLQEENTKQLIHALKRAINFHSNVPEDRKTTDTYISLHHALKEEPSTRMWSSHEKDNAQEISTATMATLGKLYARIPKKRGDKPDYQKAVFWLDSANNSDCDYPNDAMGKIIKQPEIQQAREENSIRFEKTIETTYNKLFALTNNYLKKSHFDIEKRSIFTHLRDILTDPAVQSKHERIMNFKENLNAIDKQILAKHRTESWKRYIYNVVSVVAVIPAIVRACDSRVKYGTFRFWKPESQKALEYSQENISALILENQN